MILEASRSIAQLYFSHKCLWKFKCFKSSINWFAPFFPKYLMKSQFTIYLIVFFTCLSIWHLSLVFSYRIPHTACWGLLRFPSYNNNWEMPQSWARGCFQSPRNPEERPDLDLSFYTPSNLLDVDGVVGLEAGGGDDLVPLDQLPHLLRGQLLGRVLGRSWNKYLSNLWTIFTDFFFEKISMEEPLGLSLRRCSRSHSASLHSDVTLLWVVML